MGNIIAVFGNRNNTMQFASYLRRMGVKCKTVNTPRELSVSCGISVIFESKNMNQAKFLLNKTGLHQYVRLYLITGNDSMNKYMQL